MASKKTKKLGGNSSSHTKSYKNELIVVGIGASAGGLEAFENFITNIPVESVSGIAFVLVQHLDPSHKSILTDLIKRYTKLKVFEVKDGMNVNAECIYVIPPNKDMALHHGKLHLLEPESPRGRRLPIDFFFRSLAQDQHERAICVVLSGTGSDGTLGLKAIKGDGGMVMVQDPESAKYDGMPRSAISTGMVDYILPPVKMPEQLLGYVDQAFDKQLTKLAVPSPGVVDLLQKIFILLQSRSGHDFSFYKHNTICRRIERRMAVNQIEKVELYVRYLHHNLEEVDTLFRDLLIGVTNFFRDSDAFDILKEKIIPKILDKNTPDITIRVWVPGCSTGEEAYSIAILLREHMDEQNKEFKVIIFATDIDKESIDNARSGIYPDNIAADVSAERIHRFFNKEDNKYRIKKIIRDMVIFAEQNVIENPPFSKLDLISCRNLLIYLGTELQKRVIPLFHYALKDDGYLFLGNSETIGEFTDLFSVVDRKWKLYKSKEVASHGINIFNIPRMHMVEREKKVAQDEAKEKVKNFNIREVVEYNLLSEYTPACVIINEKGE